MNFTKTSIVALLAACIALPVAAQTAVAENGGQLNIEDYLGRPQKEVQQLLADNQNKGKELYDLQQFKESLPWLDRGLFFSQVLIKQAKLRQEAREKLAEAKRIVDEAGKVVGKNPR